MSHALRGDGRDRDGAADGAGRARFARDLTTRGPAGRRSGQHLLLTWRLNGWIDHGRLHPLAPQGRVALADAW